MLDDDVIRLRDNEMCAAITFQSIEKHLFEEHIHFSFLIKRNINEALKAGTSCEGRSKEAGKPKPAAHAVPNKGSLRGNNLRKNQSIPDAVKLSANVVALKKEVELEEPKGLKSQPPDYSSINKFHNNKQFTSPAHCTEAMKRNDDELVVTNLFDLNLNVVKRPLIVLFICRFSKQPKLMNVIISQTTCARAIKAQITRFTNRNIRRQA